MRGVVASIALAAAVAAVLAAGRAAPAHAGEAAAVVAEGKVVAIEFTLRLEDGKVVDTNVGGPPLVLVEGRGEVFPGLERAIDGMSVGEKKEGTFAPKEAYGEVDPKLFVEVEISRIPEADRHAGARLFYRDESGARKLVRIDEVRADHVVVDLNHALAGNPIRYEIRVLKVEAPPPPER